MKINAVAFFLLHQKQLWSISLRSVYSVMARSGNTPVARNYGQPWEPSPISLEPKLTSPAWQSVRVTDHSFPTASENGNILSLLRQIVQHYNK